MEAVPTTQFIQALSAQLGIDQSNSLPWMPLPDEQVNEYLAFDLWCKLGTSRPAQMHKLARDRQWASRALAYDEFMSLQPASVKQQAAQVGAAIATSSNMIMTAIQLELVKLLRSIGSTQTSSLTLSEMVNSIEKLAKTSRLVAGESTDNVAHVGKFDLSKLSDDELEMADALNKKALPG